MAPDLERGSCGLKDMEELCKSEGIFIGHTIRQVLKVGNSNQGRQDGWNNKGGGIRMLVSVGSEI